MNQPSSLQVYWIDGTALFLRKCLAFQGLERQVGGQNWKRSKNLAQKKKKKDIEASKDLYLSDISIFIINGRLKSPK